MTRILVTGAAGDIGSATARVLAARRHRLVLADHPDAGEKLQETVDACRSLGADVTGVTFSVTDDDAVASAIERHEPLAGVVNSAGYQGAFVSVEGYPLEDTRRVLEVNVVGVMAVLAATARSMIKGGGGGGGSIVNIASMAGVSGAANMPAYSASKAAVIGLTKAAARDLAPHGIRVNAVSPGFIGPGRMWETQVARQAKAGGPYAGDPAQVAAQMIGTVPLGRYGSPEEVGEAVAFLLSDAASYLTGVNLEVSGGGA
ncbi:MAG TPA: SDR family NAD(P)-dependent oxidoreductase [Gaiellaceae bacterium]|nr:SDR family NAD(P)-dependent oxidoreductase [Gaiellaceae bacterium]